MKKSSKQLKNLQGKPLNAPATNYCQMLQEIAEGQRFEVLYTDIPEPCYLPKDVSSALSKKGMRNNLPHRHRGLNKVHSTFDNIH